MTMIGVSIWLRFENRYLPKAWSPNLDILSKLLGRITSSSEINQQKNYIDEKQMYLKLYKTDSTFMFEGVLYFCSGSQSFYPISYAP
jgi:hypothetical protein